MRVDVVDPPAYTPPYDHALSRGAGPRRRRRRAGHEPVRLRRGPGAPTATRSRELFYRHARGAAGSRVRRVAASSPSTCPTCSATARVAEAPTSSTSSGSTVQGLDRYLLPAPARRADRPRPAPARAAARPGPRPAAAVRARWTRSSSHSRVRARPAGRASSASTRPRSTSIHHGAFEHLTLAAARGAAARPSSRDVDRPGGPVLRPAAALQGRRRAARGVAGRRGRRAVDRRAAADAARSRCRPGLRRIVRFVPRFVVGRRGGRRSSAAPTSSSCPTRAPSGSTSRACSRPRWRSASRSCSATSAGSARSPRRAPPGWLPPDDPLALRAALAELLADPGAASGSPRRARRRREGRTRGTARPTRRSRSTASWFAQPPWSIVADRVLAVGRPCCSTPTLGYPVAARGCSREAAAADRARRAGPRPTTSFRRVSVIVAAYAEQDVIADRVANLRALDYPAERARADRRLRRLARRDRRSAPARPAPTSCSSCRAAARSAPRTRRSSARGARSSPSRTPTSSGSRDALRAPGGAVRRPARSATCAARSRSSTSAAPTRRACTGATRWRCARSSRGVRSVTGGNGAIYATRRDSYLVVDPIMGHDLSFPFNMVKRGWLRALRAREAHASEKMVPTIEGEFARKRRMMSHGWPIVLRGGMLSPRGYGPLYALMIVSHRVLRYLSPFLHVIALARASRCSARAGCTLVARRRSSSRCSLARRSPASLPCAPLLIARYYVLTTASLAAGLWDWLAPRHRRPAGSRPRGRDESGARARSRARRRRRGRSPRRSSALLGARDPARVARPPDLPPDARRQGRAASSRSTSCARWSAARSSPAPGLAIAEGDDRITRVGALPAPLLARRAAEPVERACAARCRSSGRGRRSQVQVDQYTERQRGRLAVKPGITGWAQVNGRASLPWPERIELDLWYVEHRSLALDCEILGRTVAMVARRRRASTRERRADGSPRPRRSASCSPGVGKRYDIVSAFAQHATVVAADPNPLAPAQYAAHHRARRAADRRSRATSRRCEALCDEFGVGAVVPLTDLDLEVLAHARAAGRAARVRPRRRDRAGDVRQVRGPPAARAARPAVAADRAARRAGRRPIPVMVKPRQGSGARSIHRADDARAAEFFVDYVERADDGAAADGRARVLDRLPVATSTGRCLNAIPRTMIESRGGESIKGTRDRRRRADRARPARRRGARRAAARARSRCSATARSGSGSPTSTRASAAPSRRRCTRRCPAAPTRS